MSLRHQGQEEEITAACRAVGCVPRVLLLKPPCHLHSVSGDWWKTPNEPQHARLGGDHFPHDCTALRSTFPHTTSKGILCGVQMEVCL